MPGASHLQNVMYMIGHVFGVKCSTLNPNWQNLAIFANCSIFLVGKPVGWTQFFCIRILLVLIGIPQKEI
jgi:hypothetical protein